MWNWETEAEALGIGLDKSAFLNIGYEISDRICKKGFGDKVAVICKRKSGNETALTYNYLAKESSKFALFLRGLNVVKGDRVFLYCDRIPELYLSIIGVFKSGAILSPLFSSFGPEAIKDRLADGSASTVIVQEALLENVLSVRSALPCLRNIIVISDNSCFKSPGEGVINFNEYMSVDTTDFCETTCAGDSAIIHYTSGTTGKPKGALHTHSAILGHYATSKHVLTLKSDDIYWCTADTAWVTGMSYGVIGPLSNAVTQISVEGNLNTPIILNALESYKVTVLYTAPTLLRMMMREKPENISRYNTGSLRHIAAVGEALNPEIIKWSRSSFNLPVHDTWFQTETGCIMIANTPENIIKPGSMGKPIPPVIAEILNEDFTHCAPGNSGMLAIKPKWPSMFKTYWNREDIYEEKFKNHWYLTGDNVRKDDDGYFWFIGRNDDVINTAGHLVSPFEVESALVENPIVAEAAVIGIADNMIGEKIKAFIVLRQEVKAVGSLKIELRSYVRNMISPFAVPQEIEIVESLPKTESGKVIRRLLRSM